MAAPQHELLPYEVPQTHPKLNFYNFWAEHGECVGFEMSQFQGYCIDVARFAPKGLSYHNYHHFKESLWDGMRLVRLCHEQGIEVNPRVVASATITHDIYPFDLARTALYYRRNAPRLGLTPEEISCGLQAIAATSPEGTVLTDEDKAVVSADLGNVGRDYYRSFFTKMALVKGEAIKLKKRAGLAFDQDQFDDGVITNLSAYFSRDLALGSVNLKWLQNAKVNIWNFAAGVASRRGEQLEEYLEGLGSLAVQNLLLPDTA